ncbi:unnamed protein product [Clavelina lepadiformis]|uniref:Uncharacterized protein n=1 Tax=Clavelina lepadiformis TaxID=159417 RepID=A0ABP0F9V9_CLALP
MQLKERCQILEVTTNNTRNSSRINNSNHHGCKHTTTAPVQPESTPGSLNNSKPAKRLMLLPQDTWSRSHRWNIEMKSFSTTAFLTFSGLSFVYSP